MSQICVCLLDVILIRIGLGVSLGLGVAVAVREAYGCDQTTFMSESNTSRRGTVVIRSRDTYIKFIAFIYAY
jgi:hypothetical protein